MMGVAGTTSQPTKQGRTLAASSRRRRLLGSGSLLAAVIAAAGMLATPAHAHSVVRPMPQVSVNVGVGSPMLGASSRNSLFAQPKRVAVTSIASSEYVAARGLMLDGPGAPIRPVVPEPVTPPTPPTPPSGGAVPSVPPSGGIVPSVPPSAPSISSPSAPSYDSVRNAPTGAILDAAKDGINVRARAQYNSGQVDFRPGASGDVVELLAPSAIINWDTFLTGSGGNAVTFLGTGGKLDFTSALSGYTVLNRVFTGTIDSAIRIDGAVTSTINNGAETGGYVWFYSPGGVIIGSTGAFNVGGLVLTSSQLDAIGAGGTLMEFGGVALPSSAVIVERGANITTDSYFAVVAPRIEQHGNVRSAGSVAYVAAEQAKLTMGNGLFDISVDVGTADQNGIVHTGTTSGPAASGGDSRAISMVAVPQNTAMTMLVGGNVGYQAAGGVSVDADGRIILTAGVGGSVNVKNAKLTGNTAISAGDSVRFGADAGGVTTASGDVAISAGVASVKGGSIAIASAGTVNVAGNLDLNVSASGGRNVTLGRGQVDIAASGAGSTISIGGDLTANASTDGIITEAGADVVNLSVDGTGAAGGIRIGGKIAIDTSASAGSDFITTEAGGVAIDVTGGALSFAGLTLDAQSSATGSAMGQT
ncbi:MAG: hypothetical protein WAT93_04340, partial [Pontixanthobacter sp.]